MAIKKPGRKIGRPRAEVPRKPITIAFEQDLVAAIERARERREKAWPGAEVTTSATIRALLLKALNEEEKAERQGELKLTLPMEPTTKKS